MTSNIVCAELVLHGGARAQLDEQTVVAATHALFLQQFHNWISLCFDVNLVECTHSFLNVAYFPGFLQVEHFIIFAVPIRSMERCTPQFLYSAEIYLFSLSLPLSPRNTPYTSMHCFSLTISLCVKTVHMMEVSCLTFCEPCTKVNLNLCCSIFTIKTFK